jgi:GT2 family glycosyltransferase
MAPAAVLAEQRLLLSIVVVNWNVRDLLRECLQSIYGTTRMAAGTWELIVVDNQSSDNSVEMVRREFPEVRLIENSQNTGFAKANNQAFRLCRGRFVLLLNPDVVALDFAIDRALEIMQSQPRIGVLGCSLLNSDGTEQEWTAGALPSLANVLCHYLFLYQILPTFILPMPFFPLRQPQKEVDVGWISGAFMLLRREALGKEIFDERFFMYGEDVLLCQSLARAGWRVFYTPRIRIIHHGGCSTNSQTQDVQMARFLNLRQVFGLINGKMALHFFDVGISFAFIIRSMVFAAASCIRPGRGYNTLAARNRQYLAQAIRAFGSR